MEAMGASLFRALDKCDAVWLMRTFHVEFKFIDDYALQSREEAIDHLINGIPLENNICPNERWLLVDNERFAFEVI